MFNYVTTLIINWIFIYVIMIYLGQSQMMAENRSILNIIINISINIGIYMILFGTNFYK